MSFQVVLCVTCIGRIEKLSANLQSTESVPMTEGDNLAIMSAALHAADISASAKPWKIYNEWTKRLTVEFRLQGDLGKVLSTRSRGVLSPPQDSERC